MLGDEIDSKSVPLKTGAIVGLGLAYVGSQREDLSSRLLPIVADDANSMEIASLAALALGFIFVGSNNGEIAATVLQALMERSDSALDEKWARFMILGLALLYLGNQEASDATLETLKAIEHNISKQAQILVDICAYAGTTNVLKVQSMLHHCNDHIEKKDGSKEDDTFQAFAVIGIALVAIGEDVGAEMALRQFNHLVSLCDEPQACVGSDFSCEDALWRALYPKSRTSCTWTNKCIESSTHYPRYPVKVQP